MYRKIVILSILIVVGCAYNQQRGESPVVTIDPTLDKDHKATPNPVHVRQGHWIHFYLVGSGEMEIRCDAFERTGHDHGHAWARAKVDAKGRHTYTIVVNGKEIDPEVMIDP